MLVGVTDAAMLAQANELIARMGLAGAAEAVVLEDSSSVEAMAEELNLVVVMKGALGGMIFDSDFATAASRVAFMRLVGKLDVKTLAAHPLFGVLLTGGMVSEDSLRVAAGEMIPYLPKPTAKLPLIGQAAGGSPDTVQKLADILQGVLKGNIGVDDGLNRVRTLNGRALRGFANAAGESGDVGLLAEEIRKTLDPQTIEALRLRLYHPSFSVPILASTAEAFKTPKAIIWSEKMTARPYFYQTLADRDEKLADQGVDVADYVTVRGDETALRQRLGDGADAFFGRFAGRILYIQGDSASRDELLGRIPGYEAKDAVFADESGSSLFEQGTGPILVLVEDASLEIDKVLVQILAMGGDIDAGLIRGLSRTGRGIFLYRRPAPLDYEYHLRGARTAEKALAGAA